MNILNNKTEVRRKFLGTLPGEPLRKVFLKIIIFMIGGTLLSWVAISITSLAFPFFSTKNQNLFFKETSFYLSNFIILLCIFYRGKVKEALLSIFRNRINKSVMPLATSLIVWLILGTALNLVSFSYSKNPEKWNWLVKYIQSWTEQFNTFNIYVFGSSIIIFFVFAFIEEFTFRFTIYRFLRRNGFLLAILLTSFLFTLMHGYEGLIANFLFAIIITLYYELTNNFWGIVIMHTLNNIFVVHISYYLTYLILK